MIYVIGRPTARLMAFQEGDPYDQQSFSLLAGIIFTIIALLHLLRIIYGWDPVVEGWTVPQWISWVALIVSGYLGYEGLRLAIKSRRS
jgi:hypothetical protein